MRQETMWRERLQQILHEPIYHPKVAGQSFWVTLEATLNRWLEGLHLPNVWHWQIPTWLTVTAPIMVLGVLAWLVVRAMSTDGKLPAARMTPAATSSEGRDVELPAANDCLANGQLHEAARLYFAAVIKRLQEDYPLPYTPAMTTGDFIAAVRRVDEVQATKVADIGLLCDRIWYGAQGNANACLETAYRVRQLTEELVRERRPLS